MTWPATSTILRRWLLLAALLCVLVARTAVPTGWMPVTGADGTLTLAPCTGMGAMAMAPMKAPMTMAPMAGQAMPGHDGHDGHHGHDGRQDHESGGDHPCIGAAVSVAVEAAALPLLAAPRLAPAAAEPAPLSAAIGQGLAAPPPPATGPPARA